MECIVAQRPLLCLMDEKPVVRVVLLTRMHWKGPENALWTRKSKPRLASSGRLDSNPDFDERKPRFSYCKGVTFALSYAWLIRFR